MKPILDNLERCSQWAMPHKELRQYEFFECSFCSELCRMSLTEYRQLDEQFVLSARYRCVTCAKKERSKLMEPKKRGPKPKQEQLTPSIAPANYELSHSLVNHIPEVSNMVERPPHYTSAKIECIDAFMSAVKGLPPEEAVLVGNIIKYTWRYKRKNGREDLQKAQWYLNKLIEMQEG